MSKANAGRRVLAARLRSGPDLLTGLPQPVVMALFAFADHIAALDVDYLVFMARKSVRLHDLLLAAGCRMPNAIMVTDHILDQSLTELQGKRVAIIDDTLILGTTIAEAERKLRKAGVTEISKVVFAIDEENWCREIATIDKHFVTFDSAAMLNFCASEVEALALAGIPYLTDFPVSKRVRLARSQLATIYSLPGWDSFSLTSASQEAVQVFYYTHLPTEDGLSHLSKAIGELARIIDIAKVRSFVFTTDIGHLARVIPIVTLQPLSEARVNQLFEALIREIDTLDEGQRDNLRVHLTSSRAKLRLIQYFLGLMVGEGFLTALSDALSHTRPALFDPEEAIRLFGPWLRTEIDALHVAAARIARGSNSPHVTAGAVRSDSLPADVQAVTKADCEEFLGSVLAIDPSSEGPRNTFSDLVRVFVELHKRYELPARTEARLFGSAVFDKGPNEAPHRDRLKIGFSWKDLVAFLGSREKLNMRKSRSMRLSLMLDALVDLGIAVPILCLRDGILFRAYRHGEDAPFAEQEHALAYALAEGFLDGNGRGDIPRLTMEKLLAALMRVGMAKGFLIPLYGLNGSERLARIAFHRHGTIVTLSDEASVFADSQDSWLSRHLVNIGVLVRTVNRNYGLGERPNAALIDANAPLEARQLGRLIGSLCRRPGSSTIPLLDENDLTLLTTCAQPRDAAGAVLAEIRIFNNWFEEQKNRLVEVDFDSDLSCETALKSLILSGGYAAFNSARFKLSGHWDNRAATIATKCAEHLRASGDQGRFLADHWEGVWAPVFAGATEDQRNKFDAAIKAMGGEFLTIAMGMFTMELALASRLHNTSKPAIRRYGTICKKVLSYLEATTPHVARHHAHDKVLTRLHALCSSNSVMPDPRSAYIFGLQHISSKQVFARTLAMEVSEAVRNYGRIQGRTDFKFALWYDIIDSLGQKSGLTGPGLEDYRARVGNFKASIDAAIFGLSRDAQRSRAEISILPNSLQSTEDEKDILFAHRDARDRMKEAVRLIFYLAESKGIKLRMLVLNADFAGQAPHCYHGDPTIVGAAFWEHGSRVKKWVRQEEDSRSQHGSAMATNSLLWLGGELADAAKEFDFVNWVGSRISAESNVTIDDRPLRTPLQGGPIKM